ARRDGQAYALQCACLVVQLDEVLDLDGGGRGMHDRRYLGIRGGDFERKLRRFALRRSRLNRCAMVANLSSEPPFAPAYLLRLVRLIRLRWLAIAGQTAAVVGVYFGLGVELPLGPCLAAILLSACLNIALRLTYPVTERLDTLRATMLLGFDIVQL